MSDYFYTHGIRHIFGTPYRPQGRGEIERFDRRIKGKLCLLIYCSPDELKKTIDEAIAVYNDTPHESFDNVSPNDVYAIILKKRQQKKELTLRHRKKYNLEGKSNSSDQHQTANLE